VRRITPYEWEASAAQVATAAGIPESAVVRFDTNTTPWPPVAWEQTVLDLPRLPANEYPHPSNEPLRSSLADHLGVDVERVVITSGADEALQLVANVYLGPGGRALMADPSFSMFRVVTESVGGALVRVPVDDAWDLPHASLLRALKEHQAAVAWLCSPNNPTGRLLEPSLIEAAAEAAPETVLVVDEAYHEIAGSTLAPIVARYPNGVLVRTFSKGYGLAGARVGYLVGQPEVTRAIESVRLPQNLSAFGIAAACRALADQPALSERVAAIRLERDRLETALRDRGWEIVPSAANFLLTRPPTPAATLSAWLQQGGLIVRSYPGHARLNDWLRITVRSPEEDARLLARIDALSPAT
jgi:histidinol-phosphate aminotransferase